MTLREYLTEPVIYGGAPSTRAEIIRDMQEQGIPQKCIDRYLQGLDLRLKMAR